MWATDPGWDEVLGGDHWGKFAAFASYDGQDRGELEVVGGSITRSWDGSRVRSSASVTITDPDGLLVPRTVTDTLAPFGQVVTLRHVLGVGDYWESSIPLGAFVVTDPGPDTQWAKYRHGYVASGTVTVGLADLWERVIRNDLAGFHQAPAGATVRTEVTRLCNGVVSVNSDTIPTTGVPSSAMVHPQSRAEAIENLLDLAGRSPVVNREARLDAVDATKTGTVVWSLTDDDIVEFPTGVPSDEGVHNVWEVTGERDADGRTPIRTVLTERDGPLRQSGWVFGTRVFRHSAPIYQNQAAAAAAARTFRAKELATRGIEFQMTTVLRPELDVLDTVNVPLVPPNHAGIPARRVNGLVTEISHGATGTMQVKFSVPWGEAGVL